MARITLESLSKNYDRIRAVDSLSIEVQEGEFLVILGPPGAGKSSTIKMIAGVESASSGEVFFDDRPMGNMPPNKRNVAMVFESYALYPDRTAYRNIAYPLQARKRQLNLTPEEIDRRVKQVAELLRITEQLQRKPAFLSGGQRQRVALARALVREPDVFLFDEPIAHLDARLRHHLRGELKRQHQETKTTTVWCTPDYLEAIAMGDRIAVLYEGNLKQLDSPAEILKSPATVEVAQLLGDPSINVLPARIKMDEGKMWLDLEGSLIPASREVQQIVSTAKGIGDTLMIGLRPSDIVVHQTCIDSSALLTELYSVETLHRKSVVSLSLGAELLKVNASRGFRGKVGDPIWIELALDKALVFDSQTGLALTA